MGLTFRNARVEDAALLFEWRNDPTTRLSSHNHAEVSFDSHVSWLNASLINPTRTLMIAEYDGQPVGTVRIDQKSSDSIELSWTVAPHARRRGIATQMIQLIVDDISRNCIVRAEVKTRNKASIKVAEAAGMKVTRQDGDTLYFLKPASK